MNKLIQTISIAVITLAALLFGAVKVLAYAPPVLTNPGMQTTGYTYDQTPTQPSYSYANAPVITYSRYSTTTSQNSGNQTSSGNGTTGLANENRPGLLEQLIHTVGTVPAAQAPETICANDTVTSTIQYSNTTGHDSVSTVVTIIFPEQIDFVSSSVESGSYNEQTRTYTVSVGPLAKGQSGLLYITERATKDVRVHDSMTIQVNVNFTEATGALHTLTNYIYFSSDNCQQNLGALAIASGFFPTTFVGWLILAILVCLIIYFSRRFFGKSEGHGHGHDAHDNGHGHPAVATQMEDKAWATEHGA